jgi:hypothetical protein
MPGIRSALQGGALFIGIELAAAHKTATTRTWGGAWHTDGCAGAQCGLKQLIRKEAWFELRRAA